MVSEEIHHLEEVTFIATAVRQRKKGAWTKWESENDSYHIGDLEHIEPQKLSFLIKAVYDVLPKEPVRKLPASNEYALSYIWRHNEVLEIFAEATKICCETANKALNNITNRAIHFVKVGNISKLPHKNKH